jgi:predicted Zn-dependent protease
VSVVDAGVAVQSSYGPKHAVVTTNDLSEASLRRCVEQSERLAKLAPDDPEAMPELDPQRYVDVNGLHGPRRRTSAPPSGRRPRSRRWRRRARRATSRRRAIS